MGSVLLWTHVIVSILLSIAVLTQNQGSGLSATFGGTGGFYAEKRGADKVLYRLTVALAFIFVLTSLGFLFVDIS